MPNSPEHARWWTEFVAGRGEIRNGPLILEHFKAGHITRICDCGCNSYDIEVAPNERLPPLVPSSERGGMVFQMEFHTNEVDRTLSISLFVDKRGYLSGIDVDLSGNAFPVPEFLQLKEPPFHVYGKMRA